MKCRLIHVDYGVASSVVHTAPHTTDREAPPATPSTVREDVGSKYLFIN